jgi:acetyl esterase/lipase
MLYDRREEEEMSRKNDLSFGKLDNHLRLLLDPVDGKQFIHARLLTTDAHRGDESMSFLLRARYKCDPGLWDRFNAHLSIRYIIRRNVPPFAIKADGIHAPFSEPHSPFDRLRRAQTTFIEGVAQLFLLAANDDPMGAGASLPLYTAWRDAGHPVELHLYAQGGHGFGMKKQGLPSDHWIDRFGDWLQAHGFLA